MKDGRTKHRLLATLVADPYRKLASVALAIGLWYFLDTQIRQDYPVNAALRPVNESARPGSDTTPGNTLEVLLPTSKIAVLGFVNPKTQKAITEVHLVFSGPKYLIDNLQGDRQLTLSAGPFPGRLWENAEVVEFTAASIVRTSRVLHELRIAMDPPVVQVQLERKQSRQFTLSKDTVELQFRNPEDSERLRPRLLWNRLEFRQEQVTVIGPRSRLDRFPAADTKPFVAIVEPINSEREVSGSVNLNLPNEDLDMELDVITSMTIELAPKQEEFWVEIPIRVDDLSLSQQGVYKPDTPTKTVKIKASGKLKSMLDTYAQGPERNKWARENLRLSVWIQPRENEPELGPEITAELHLDLAGPQGDQVDAINYGLVEHQWVKLVKVNK